MALSNPTTLTVVIEDPEGRISASYRDLIIENIRFSWDRWDAFIDADPNASIDLVVRPLNNTDNTLATSASVGSVLLYDNVLRGTVGNELISGVDKNGADFDGVINISTYHINQNRMDFSLDGVTPNNKISFKDVITHEMGHILGLNGWFNSSTYQTPFELLVDQGAGVFLGENAVAVNGGPVKLEASSAPTHTNEQTFDKSIMSPIIKNGGNEEISLVELAMLADIGLPINIDFISSNNSSKGTAEVNSLSNEAKGGPNNEFFNPHFDGLVDGGAGVDTMIFDDVRSQFDIALNDNLPAIISTTELTQEIVSIERLQFKDVSLALDVDENAGVVAKILGSVFGVEALSNKKYVGIGLNLLDEGMSYADLSVLALTVAGASNYDEIVTKLFTNVVGVAPTDNEKMPFVAMLENGTTIGQIGMIAGDSDLNILNIDLVGLSQTGIEFI